jgi:hypothetical protein
MAYRPRVMSGLATGSISGNGPSGSYAERSRPQTCSRKAIAVAGLTCCSRMWRALSRPSVAVSPSANVAAGNTLRSWGFRPNARGACPHVGAVTLSRIQFAMRREHRVGVLGTEVAAVVGIAGLQNHQVALRAGGQRCDPAHVELRAVMLDGADSAGADVSRTRSRLHGWKTCDVELLSRPVDEVVSGNLRFG